ncbi:MAG: aminotransferase class IV, partial [Pseudomonadota bacterium]
MMDDEHGVHDYVYDERNADIQVSINGELKHRDEATVSVFESGYLLGDGVWEGLRVYQGGVAFLDAHLKRLYAGAKT